MRTVIKCILKSWCGISVAFSEPQAVSIKLICEIDITQNMYTTLSIPFLHCLENCNIQTLINITNSKSFLSHFMIHNMFSL